MLQYNRITEDEKYIITGWKYSGDYAIYNVEPYNIQKEKGIGFANPENNFFAFYDNGILVGYTNLYEEDTEVFFGIGVNPLYCGNGYGGQMTTKTIELSHELFPNKPLYLEVRTWNERAVKCYKKAGFRIAGESFVQTTYAGEGTFYRMIAGKWD